MRRHARARCSTGCADSTTSVSSDALGAVVRRWPWALGAGVLGAAVGAVVAYLVRRVGGEDAPDAQDPEELQAVVDRPPPAAPSSPARRSGDDGPVGDADR